jgi:tRNA/rRNA methyltransferase
MSIIQVKIVLVEPAGEINIGSIARVMKNMGLQHLVMVNPQCNPCSETAKIMAVHGIDVLENAQIVPNIPMALQGCYRAIATTARNRSLPTKLETPSEGLSWLLEENRESALIFGSEERGLSNQELNYAQRFVTIPANPKYPSLNLAQAVAVCAYELYQASLKEVAVGEVKSEVASLDALEAYYQHLESVLLKISYLQPHTAKARMEKFRRLFNRADLQEQEVSMLRGILRQMEWAMGQNKL